MNINCNGKILDLSSPKIMAVINVNNDSFYEGSRVVEIDSIVQKVESFKNEGASIIDFGVMSSRPGASLIDAEQEIKILQPILEVLLGYNDLILSVDTVWSKTAQVCIDKGVSIINDISASSIDPNLMHVLAQNKPINYVLMHMKGLPQNMQSLSAYDDLILEMLHYFATKIHECKKMGITNLMIDPGFGFAKTLEQNYHLLNHLEVFKILDLPILTGLSRKSMIYNLLKTDAENALNGTTAVHTIALTKGANILRVHDVKQALEVVQIFNQLNLS